ncbi:MAG: PEP-CTERM sorting domain-containing protein [Phycisphaeraceae bacterium]|nr:PEP-CTERM sorting domain-containing protein [Phycisphaeraceae bacterium]
MARTMRSVVVLAGAASLTGLAQGQTELQVDFDALSAMVSGPMSESFTGSLHVYNTLANPDIDGDASILDVLIDGDSQQTGGASVAGFAFDMMIRFLDGRLTGGELMFSVNQSGTENTYASTILPSPTVSILQIAPNRFILGGLLGEGAWSEGIGTFLGVDINPWATSVGSFSQIEMNFGANRLDPDTDVDVFLNIPAPSSLALLGLGGLVATRRRR